MSLDVPMSMRSLFALSLLLISRIGTAQPPLRGESAQVAIWGAVVRAAYPPETGVRVSAATINMARAPRAMSRWVDLRAPNDTVAVLDMISRNPAATPIDSAILRTLQRNGDRSCIATLTLPGLNQTGDVAFVYGQFGCGLGSAWDSGFWLERRQDTWVVVARRRYSVE